MGVFGETVSLDLHKSDSVKIRTKSGLFSGIIAPAFKIFWYWEGQSAKAAQEEIAVSKD